MKGFTSCLWFDNQAEEAARFYTSVFKNSRIGTISRYGEAAARASGHPKGSVLTVEFELAGQKFLGLNGGPEFKFSEAVSFIVNCENQQEIDEFWAKLSEGGSEGQCGWLKDKYGLSWQVVPTTLGEMLTDKDPARAERVMAALLTMRKLDIAALRRAYDDLASEAGAQPAGVGGSAIRH
ncbi:MAG TPA: VOC family protein [Gemmatimonadales bacterium]|jgi:predicted 3-demethylubiquinone-9 3-methyltransferase (glyoxalase superfamily)|nr:VOC family protein [Gemmatimonadales bacterium]